MTTPLMEPLCAQATVDTLGELVVNGVSMHVDGAWNCLNPTGLWIWTDTKGQNRPIPGGHGDRAFPWRIASGTHGLPFLIEGIYDVGLGEYATSPWVGLQHNIEYLRENVIRPPAAPAKTRSASLTLPDGVVANALVQPRLLEYTPTETETWNAVMTLVVPRGEFRSDVVVPLPPCAGGTTNDAIAGATELVGDSGTETLDMSGYTRERDEPDHLGNADDGTGFWASAWWTITVPDGAGVNIDVDTIGSDFDTLLAIYYDSSVGIDAPPHVPNMSDLSEYYSDDDSGGSGTSAISGAFLDGGFQFWIAVAGNSGASGNAVLNWSITPA